MRKLLFWALSGSGALVIGAAGVSPNDAATNLVAWATIFGIESPPSWLASANADSWGVFLGISLVLASIAGALRLRPAAVKPLPAPSGSPIVIINHNYAPQPLPDESTDMDKDSKKTVHNVTSNNQSGGVTAHTVNVDTTPARSVNAEMSTVILQETPKSKPVRVWGMNGDTESMNFANEIFEFLKSRGYDMIGDNASWHMFFDPPVYNVKLTDGEGGKESWIVVGPAR